jgi:hypothetical protein
MNDNESALGVDAVIRHRNQAEGRLNRAEREPAVPSTVPHVRRKSTV